MLNYAILVTIYNDCNNIIEYIVVNTATERILFFHFIILYTRHHNYNQRVNFCKYICFSIKKMFLIPKNHKW